MNMNTIRSLTPNRVGVACAIVAAVATLTVGLRSSNPVGDCLALATILAAGAGWLGRGIGYTTARDTLPAVKRGLAAPPTSRNAVTSRSTQRTGHRKWGALAFILFAAFLATPAWTQPATTGNLPSTYLLSAVLVPAMICAAPILFLTAGALMFVASHSDGQDGSPRTFMDRLGSISGAGGISGLLASFAGQAGTMMLDHRALPFLEASGTVSAVGALLGLLVGCVIIAGEAVLTTRTAELRGSLVFGVFVFALTSWAFVGQGWAGAHAALAHQVEPTLDHVYPRGVPESVKAHLASAITLGQVGAWVIVGISAVGMLVTVGRALRNRAEVAAASTARRDDDGGTVLAA